MAKKSKKSLSVLSTALTGATLVVDFYNSYIYRSKNRKLSYISAWAWLSRCRIKLLFITWCKKQIHKSMVFLLSKSPSMEWYPKNPSDSHTWVG
ncbi:hypothetical protein L6Q64_13125 [Staphylococcus pseudintermedius]|nr:hypothetical protein L6Q64_13125 [Staphylococcus pseudintermedius]